MKMTKILGMLIVGMFVLVSGCNDGGKSEEDKEFDALYEEAVASALSPENIARNAREDASRGGSGGGGGGGSFVWKPRSDSNGNLVVLLPSAYANVSSITVRGSGGSGSSVRSAIANGGRPHFRFPMPGAAYGNNITVSGGGRTWRVANGGRRVDL